MKLERIISLTLRVGVVSSALLVVSGLILLYLRGERSLVPTSNLSLFDLARLLVAGNAESIILLGVIVLIMTPVARVFELFIDYAWSRDRIYTALSIAVLTLMLFGIFILPVVR